MPNSGEYLLKPVSKNYAKEVWSLVLDQNISIGTLASCSGHQSMFLLGLFFLSIFFTFYTCF